MREAGRKKGGKRHTAEKEAEQINKQTKNPFIPGKKKDQSKSGLPISCVDTWTLTHKGEKLPTFQSQRNGKLIKEIERTIFGK